MFRAIMDALRGRRAEVIELAAPSHDILTFGDIAIYPDRRTVLKAGEEVRLNHGEFSMLLLLASAPGQVFSKDQLYDAAWNEKYRYGTTAVENIIWRLRQKLEDDPRHPPTNETFSKHFIRRKCFMRGRAVRWRFLATIPKRHPCKTTLHVDVRIKRHFSAA